MDHPTVLAGSVKPELLHGMMMVDCRQGEGGEGTGLVSPSAGEGPAQKGGVGFVRGQGALARSTSASTATGSKGASQQRSIIPLTRRHEGVSARVEPPPRGQSTGRFN